MNTSQTNIENRILLQKLFEVSNNLYEYLKSVNIENDHNLGLNVTRMINQRQNIINQFGTEEIQWSLEEKELLVKISKINGESNSKLTEVYQAVGKKISKIQQGKQVNQTYQKNYYNSYNTDGSYFDSKK